MQFRQAFYFLSNCLAVLPTLNCNRVFLFTLAGQAVSDIEIKDKQFHINTEYIRIFRRVDCKQRMTYTRNDYTLSSTRSNTKTNIVYNFDPAFWKCEGAQAKIVVYYPRNDVKIL